MTALACAQRAEAAAISARLLQHRLESKPDSPFAWSALAEWRTRHADDMSAGNAHKQAEQARREWLRRVGASPSRAA